MSLWQLCERFRCIAIIGMEKNAGKTTVLNYLLKHAARKTVAITSIGYDGEDTDQITQTDKPRIYVGRGTIVATAVGLLGRCDVTRELLKFTGFATAMGEVVLLRALSDGYVQIAGPSINAQMEKLVQMLIELNVDKIFIDGAASRKSSAAIAPADACILATGAAFSPDPDFLVEQTAFYAGLFNLPAVEQSEIKEFFASPLSEVADHNGDNDVYAKVGASDSARLGNALDVETAGSAALVKDLKVLVFKGVMPTGFAARFLEKTRDLQGLQIIVRDGTRLLLTLDQYREFTRRGATFSVCRQVPVLAVTVNPTSPSGLLIDSAYLKSRIEKLTRLPVFDLVNENQPQLIDELIDHLSKIR
ncbi:MAG: hypothetical protein ACOYXC_10570 [Candidatus Rifleibacteriota bacterium]